MKMWHFRAIQMFTQMNKKLVECSGDCLRPSSGKSVLQAVKQQCPFTIFTVNQLVWWSVGSTD